MFIKKIFLILLLLVTTKTFCLSQFLNKSKSFTIMLNPAGDAKDAGRTLQDSFERGITLQFVQELKKRLELNFPNTRIILTRTPGETIEVLQNANFSNRLNTDFYLSIHFYKEKEVLPQIYLYHYLNDPFFVKSAIKLYFYTFDNAHLLKIDKTIEYANKFKKTIENELNKKKYDFKGFFGIPFKPLIGIKAPALAIEIGLKNNDFNVFLNVITEAIGQIIK